MFEKLPFWGQVAAMVAIAAAIVGVAYWLWPGIEDQGTQIEKLRTELSGKQAQIDEGHAIEQKLPEFEAEIASLERKLGDIQQILPNRTETGDLLRWIKNLGDQSNLDLNSFAPAGLKPVDFYKEFPIDMQVTGKYHDLGVFLDRVSKYSRIVNVDNLSMSATKGGGEKTIRASFTATTFVYDTSEPASESEEFDEEEGK
jgi:type IV pilus assembly protein PilO